MSDSDKLKSDISCIFLQIFITIPLYNLIYKLHILERKVNAHRLILTISNGFKVFLHIIFVLNSISFILSLF